jgi:uncharacterized protein (TIGR02145 family)
MKHLVTFLILSSVILFSGCKKEQGCTNPQACNFSQSADEDDGSCYLPGDDCDDGNSSTLNDSWREYCICEGDLCEGDIYHEGYIYSAVPIGNQCWFSENCRYLPEVSPSSSGSEASPYYYVKGYEGSNVAEAQATDHYETYGVIYNWPAVMTEGICPSGWHVPSDGEFTELTDFLGGIFVAGGKMKEAGYDHWNSSNTGATNSSGWTGLPGGGRLNGSNDPYYYYGHIGAWWSASESDSNASWGLRLYSNHDYGYRVGSNRGNGFSARCVRD